MPPHTSGGTSSRAPFRSCIIPVLVISSVITTALTTVGAPAASAAPVDGTYTIGQAPVELNQSTDPELGSITPSPDAAENGMFGSQQAWPLLPLHGSLSRNGHVTTYGSPLGGSTQNGVAYDDWDPSAGFGAHTDTASMHGYDSFCNSAVTLADGRLLMVSGQYNPASSSEMSTMLYDPVTHTQDMGADLAFKRWYVTALRLIDGRILLLGGGDAGNTQTYLNPDANAGVATTPEIGTGTGAWTQLTGAESTILFGARDNHWWYPRAFNAPSGGVVGFSGDIIWSLSTDGTGSTKVIGALPFNPRVSGSQVMYAPGKILIAGGGQNEQADGIVANDDAAVVDVTNPTPVVTRTQSMAHRRNWLNLTVLPTGEVLANGGTVTGTAAGDANAVKQVEIWNPTTGTWRSGASALRTRTYHQTALLLPSGGVLTAGGGGATYTGSGAAFGPENNLNAEIYYPAYLFTKTGSGAVAWADRPAITAISGSATYGGSVELTMDGARRIRSASLISVPTVTHDQNTDQRRIPLDITQEGATVTAGLPQSIDTMPPGDYELTVVDSDDVPSAAQIVTIRRGEAGQVTVAPGTRVDAGGSAGAGGAPGNTGMPASGAPVAAPGSGTASGTPGTVSGTGGTATESRVALKRNSTIAFSPASARGSRVAHKGSRTAITRASSKSSKALKRATTWVVRSALGSRKGYSFESLDTKGYFLAAPKNGTGAVTLLKKSKSASFAKRVTFSAVRGSMGRDLTFVLTTNPTTVLRASGSRLLAGPRARSMAASMAADFIAQKGLAKR